MSTRPSEAYNPSHQPHRWRTLTWPTLAELADWMDQSGENLKNPMAAEVCLYAAIEHVARRTGRDMANRPWTAEQFYETNEQVVADVPVGTATAGTVGELGLWQRLAPGCSTEVFDSDEESGWCYLGAAPASVEITHTIFAATLRQAARWYQNRVNFLGGTLGVDALGGVVRAAALDADVEVMLANERRFGVA